MDIDMQVDGLFEEVKDLRTRLQYLVNYVCDDRETDAFTFPDGDIWYKTQPVEEN